MISMINIVIMNDAGTDGYASVFEVNKNNYFAKIFEHNNEIICTITRLGEEIIEIISIVDLKWKMNHSM